MKQVSMLISTFFYTGYLPIAPGTWASLVTTVLVYFIRPYWEAPYYFQIPVIVIIFIMGIPAAGAAEKHFDKKDPRKCVIDEVAGQMVSLLFVPHDVYFYGFPCHSRLDRIGSLLPVRKGFWERSLVNHFVAVSGPDPYVCVLQGHTLRQGGHY